MRHIEQYDKLAFLLFQLDCGIGLLDVIYECMNCGKHDTEMFTPAVYAAHKYFISLRKTLIQLKEDALVMWYECEESERNFIHQQKG